MIREPLPFLVFKLCGQQYAVSIDDVVEVAAMVKATRFRGGEDDPALYGMVIRRGEPLMLVDLRHVFACEAAPVDLTTLFVVVEKHQDRVGFIVDGVQGVVYFPQEAMRPVHSGAAAVWGVVAHEGALVQLLDVTPIFANTLPEDLEIDDTNDAKYTP